jgi:hypothetical protein
MALLKNYYDANLEVEVEGCYWKITKIEGNKLLINFLVGVYRTKEKADANFPPINEIVFQFTPDLSSSDNFLTQGYNYLKTLDEFKDAVDV